MEHDDPTVTAPHIKVLATALPTLSAVAVALAEADAYGEATICSGLITLIRAIVETETAPEDDVRLAPDGTRYMLLPLKGGDA